MSPDPNDIPGRLATYLDTRLSVFRLLASGWETTIYEFSLVGSPPRMREIPANQPLILRFYQGSRADDKGAREAAAIRLLAELNYPVPRPYVFEPEHAPLGAPFLLMERVAGRPLFSILSFPQAFKTFSLGFISFVRTQARLHSLGTGQVRLDAFPQAYATADSKALPLLQRIFQIIERRIWEGPLPGLAESLASLREKAARFSPAPDTIVHMDYHPQNVMVSGLRVTGVIDWVNTDRGDRYLCAATTSAILSSTAMARPRWMGENAAGHTLRGLFAALYLPLYNAFAPIELERFRFAQAVAAVLRLSMFGMMRQRGPDSVGFRPEAIENVTPSVVRLLSHYASRKSGVTVSI
jgi:aminoglycoside phosphotransferase (APT) family kinase protein